ncbi:hypothetical protein LB518_22745 [Mesorhizobium sp. BR1-1-16]|uniref:phage baseplate protein n=1 Tax=Mesorhizobium sp. BR1-1-16 TaxID=2876653 RepID=UPI001CCFF464|nr:hypothetical protein [Mesorhizobium sp. BR1-1-16]MBZ9939133.1 hypothetical protein [Mesorhizobium sp. BR1-1-16]
MAGILDTAAAVAVIIRPARLIGFLIPDVTIEETARDNLFITQHPVEQGASISDHAFAMPVELEMTVGWSNATAGIFGFTYIVYQEMLALQKTRRPFTVYTPGRSYQNMLIRTVEKRTNAQIADSLIVRVILQQVLIVSTQVTSTGSAATQASPQKTAPTANLGTKQLKPSNGYAGNGA